MSKLIQNAFYVPSIYTYFASWNSHDYIVYNFPDGKHIYFDGGLSYARRGGNLELLENGMVIDVSLTVDSPKEEIYNKLLWGTRGKDGNDPLRYRPIKEFTLEHLMAIIKNCNYAPDIVKQTVNYWADKKSGTNYV